jgi:hypothetical protein
VQPPARYRAPSESGQKLCVPTWAGLGALLAANLAWRAEQDFELLGRPLSELTSLARREIRVSERRDHVDASLRDAKAPLIVTGHQPGLIHPGVWVKNFATAALAAVHGGSGLHLVIDADVCRTPAIVVPTGTVDAPRAATVEFDRVTSAAPWEERSILDDDLWRTFPERVHEVGGDLLSRPFLNEWWPTAIERGAATRNVGTAISQARHATEVAWGAGNLELAQSMLCQTAAFRRFACAMLADLPRFVADYNGALADYRRAHGPRNHAHPVPNLANDGPWLEAPFWIWTTADPQRRPAFVRREAGGLLLSDRRGADLLLPLAGPGASPEDAIAALAEGEAAGVKLRSRALITTMFTRLVVADLFIHGIGGAKYDEATDEISRRFFGMAPPAFATMSGTLRLPIAHPSGDVAEVRRFETGLRGLAYHPERHLAAAVLSPDDRRAVDGIVAEKSRWISQPKQPESTAERHREIVAANAALQPYLADERQRLTRGAEEATARARANRVLDSREYAACLFPRENLQKFFLDFARPAL